MPTVTQNTNNLAINATTLAIAGTGFDTIAANNTVSLSSGSGTVTSATATQLIVTFNTAPSLGTLGVSVTTNGISSGNAVGAANIVEVPVITSISPAAGPKGGGNTITINGLSFVNVTGVTIGGIAATNYTVVNGQKITATIPPGVFGSVNVLVTTTNGTNSATANAKFNYTSGAFDAPAEPFSPSFPYALSINKPGSVVGASASFTVTFNQPVTGVDATDFDLVTSGTVAGGTISSITGSGQNYTVNVTGITGSGTLGLNLAGLPTITALPSFAAQSSVSTGSKPASVILGDVNGDGNLDIITANFNSANVSVLLGNGNGTFSAKTDFATGTDPFAVRLGDVNGDGLLDIITANKGSNNASVLLGNGNGTFQTQATFSTGSSPRSVALGDVNGDGTLDIITANQGSSNVSVLLGTGNGSFAGQAVDTLNAAQSYSVALGDVNGDGKLDIVAGNRSGSNGSLLLGNGDGTFQASQVFSAGGAQCFVALGDVNGDGKLDIVIARAGNDVALVIGNGNGTFQGPQTVGSGTNPRSLSLADVNGDGRLDILTANFGSTANNASVLLGNGNGTFQGAANFATGTNPRSAVLGDVNGDGRLDIVAANYNSDNASVILGTGGSATFATFSPQQTFTTGNGAQSQALGDLNGDGKLDMVTANGGNSTASVLLGNGNGTFAAKTDFATGTAPRSVTLGDVNDDGRLDIITANRDSNTASVLLGNGNGTFQTQTTVSTGSSPRSVTLGDVNGDGRLDIITANNNDNNASVLLGNGNGTFQSQTTVSTGSSPRSVALGDVNGDGRLDMITANNSDASASVLLGNGNGTFQAQTTVSTGSNPRSLTLGDVNGDGKLDIITANFAANTVSVLLGNGNGTFQAQSTFATNRPYSVTLGDLNGDGRIDIITANYSSDATSVLFGNGNGTFAAQVSFAAGDGPLSVALGDLNGDGRLDITTANFNSGNTSLLLNSLAFTGQTATVDAIAPPAPSITSIIDDVTPITGTVLSGGISNDISLLLTGTAEAASIITIYNGSTLLGNANANGTGTWSYTASGLTNGTAYAFNATATDAAGNVSPASSPNYSVTVDTTAPAVQESSNNGSGGGNTSPPTPVVTTPSTGLPVPVNATVVANSSATNSTNNGLPASGTTVTGIIAQADTTLPAPLIISAKNLSLNQLTSGSGGSVPFSLSAEANNFLASYYLPSVNYTTNIGAISTAASSNAPVISFELSTNSPIPLGAAVNVTQVPTTVMLTLANQFNVTAFVKINPTTGKVYDFTYDPITGTGAQMLDIDGNGLVDTVKITIIDGGAGDDDGIANGFISDPGILAVAPRADIFRFYNPSKATYFFTESSTEKDAIISMSNWGYKYEGVAYQSLITQGTALYRFYNRFNGDHFYTADLPERNNILARQEWGYAYEGEACKVSLISQYGMSTPVHRFLNASNGAHFYTSSENERASIIASLPNYRYEGVSWYV